MAKQKSTMKKERITPAIAREMLVYNTRNRTVEENTVASYSRQMKSGEWTECTHPIVFGVGGEMYDGQNRLLAVIRSGKAQDFWVMRNASESCRPNIDNHKPRRAADWLTMLGVPNARMVAAALRMIWKHETGHAHERSGKAGNNERFSALLAEAKLQENEYIQEFVRLTKTHMPPRGIMPATVCAYACLFARHDYGLSVEFVKGMGDGFNPELRTAFHMLREMIIKQPRTATPYSRNFISAFFIQAWNAEVKKEKSFRRWNGATPFPKIGD